MGEEEQQPRDLAPVEPRRDEAEGHHAQQDAHQASRALTIYSTDKLKIRRAPDNVRVPIRLVLQER